MKIASWYNNYKVLRKESNNFLPKEYLDKLFFLYRESEYDEELATDFNSALCIAYIAIKELGLNKAAVCTVMLYPLVKYNKYNLENSKEDFSEEIYKMINGLNRVKSLYGKTSAMETENFRKLLLTFAEDVRVVFIMLSERLYYMRTLHLKPTEAQLNIARETAFLYAPLAHRMGLYKIKTEMEDLSLKYTLPDIYRDIARKLSETKKDRDLYIEKFIAPIKDKLESLNLKFTIKGRTKSIYSIWNKMKKQNTNVENIYDLFAIRVILDSELVKEKAECWQVYSVVTDMYQPNPKRLRDWLSNPKTNGYESLHTTVMGPEGKWVEVQIRTERMDEVAEKGMAAHWKYKGIQGEATMDAWLKNLRNVLENPDLKAEEYMDEFKLNLYDEEVFVFTPNGDLYKLPKGATLLDFAFSIHTKLGCTCIGGKLGNKNVNISYVLKNGDQIEVLTSSNQKPRADWLKLVCTSKAKQKIRQVIKETETHEANMGREIILRRFKNWKVEFDEARLSRLSKKLGYKTISELYIDINKEEMDLLEFKESYLNFDKKEESTPENISAQSYKGNDKASKEDVLIINNETKGVQYTMAKCCNPIYGDDIFGFVSVSGGIKIHRKSCPNAPQMMAKFGYRIVSAAWEASSNEQSICTLYVSGRDDLGVITNISSLISKENSVTLRSISIESDAGSFEGKLVLTVKDLESLERIIQKIKNVNGVHSVVRS